MKFTAQRIKRDLETHHPDALTNFLSDSKDRDYQFWKRNALCVDLYSDVIIEEKLNYIHRNPVKAGLVSEQVDYRFSSAGFYAGHGDKFGFLSDYRA